MPKVKKSDPNIEEAGMGHNSLSPAELKNICERVESLIEERKATNEEIKTIMTEAESKGFDKKTVKEMIKIRSMDADDFKEREDLRDLYLAALGLV